MAQMDTEFAVEGSSIICLEAGLWVRNLRLKRKLPGPFAWPVVGNAMQLGQMPHITFCKYGNVYQIRLGCSNLVVLNGDRAKREALMKHSTEVAGRPNVVSFQGGENVQEPQRPESRVLWEHIETLDPEVLKGMIGVIDNSDSDNRLTEGHTEGMVSNLIGAGLDLISTAPHWVLLLLAKHPEIQIKLEELIDKVVYSFIYETMCFISFVPVYHLRRHHRSGRNPHLFDSLRFLDEEGTLLKDLTNNVMIRSARERRCIGNQIAKPASLGHTGTAKNRLDNHPTTDVNRM
ncbi:Cytochrome P450 1B1 [Liparis tanakae]|uniref:Cytochrome P450 1B1 n=1 Tax=Liparis tanakae TaxID=230148 RepID=A0A4Z2JD24_9TELE|nr:Cytochrome P450 1B1 [Liparis tanakae]